MLRADSGRLVRSRPKEDHGSQAVRPGVSLWCGSRGKMASPRPICLTSGLRRSLLALENQGEEIHTWVDDVGKKGASLCVEAQTCLAHARPTRPGPLTPVCRCLAESVA